MNFAPATRLPHDRFRRAPLVNLCSSMQLPTRPAFIPKGRPRGTKALGKTFEKKVAKELRVCGWSPLSGVWFQFLDDTGTHYAEIDHLLLFPSHAVVIECKLTQVECADDQLRFYLPIVEKAIGRKACGIIAVKHLRRETECVLPAELATWDKAIRTWHLPV